MIDQEKYIQSDAFIVTCSRYNTVIKLSPLIGSQGQVRKFGV